MSIKPSMPKILKICLAALLLVPSFASAREIALNNESSEALFEIVRTWGDQAVGSIGAPSYVLHVFRCNREFPEGHAECSSMNAPIGGEPGDLLFEAVEQAFEDSDLDSEEGRIPLAKISCLSEAPVRCSITFILPSGGGNSSIGGKTTVIR